VEPEAARDRLSHGALRTVEWLGMRMPRPASLYAADRSFRWFFELSTRARRTVAANLSMVLGLPADTPIVQSATRECFRLYGRYWYETFALRAMSWEEVDRRFSIDGLEHLDQALAAGHGVLVALPHMGNWDAAGHWLCLQGYRVSAVAEVLKPRSVYELFLRHRRALGMNIVPLSDGRRTGNALVRLLAENHVVTLVADRDLTRRGVEVEMFGAPRLLPAGPAYLALGTGTPLCVAAVFTTAEGWHCRINPPVDTTRSGTMRDDVTAVTHQIAEQFERFIASSPTDWHMFQPAWEDARASVPVR
jgi:lauroyl/myristoyl acyltransferase